MHLRQHRVAGLYLHRERGGFGSRLQAVWHNPGTPRRRVAATCVTPIGTPAYLRFMLSGVLFHYACPDWYLGQARQVRLPALSESATVGGATVPTNTIRALSRDLYEALTKERSFDAATGFELGRLAAQLTLITGMGSAPLDASHSPSEAAPSTSSANGASDGGKVRRDHRGHFVATGVKRQRQEKRPMRRPQRVVTGPDGHVVVFDFERLQIKDSPPDGDPHTYQLPNRNEMWARWKKAKKFFRVAQPA